MRKFLKKIATVVATAALATAMCLPAFAADSVYVVGAKELTGSEWALGENEMTDNGDGTYTKVFENVPAGDFGFKVVVGTAWGDAYNLEGAANGMGDDAHAVVEAAGSTVTVTFDGSKASIKIEAGGSGTQAETPAAETPAAETPEDTAPQTGDATPVVATAAALVALGCAVVVMNAKKANR